MTRNIAFATTFLTIALTLLLTTSGLSGGVDQDSENTLIPSASQKGEDFTHNVLLELFVTTWCGYCPSAEAVAKQLSGEYGEHFVFVTMVSDVNDKAQE